MRDIIMVIGIVMFIIGIIVKIFNAKWSWRTGAYTRSKNKTLSLVGWILIIVGLAIVVLVAYQGGQLN